MKKVLVITLIMLAVLSFGSGSLSCSRGNYSGKTETITIGETPFETASLLYIAEERGLFPANGLNIVFLKQDSGVASANALLRGEVDLAMCAEFVIVGDVFKKEDIRTMAVIDKFENTYIVGRKDKGINGIADLKGKRIGVTRQTSDEFYLGRFLEINGLNIQQVTLVNITRAQSVDALVSGSVDGVAFIQPFVNTVKQKFGDSVIIWPAQAGQLDLFNIIGKTDWVASHPELINRLLTSLVQAEKYVMSHPEEAKTIIKKRLNYDDSYINAVWSEHQFSLSLDLSLIVAMEDEARWMISNNLTTEKQVPNFLDYIYEDGLKAVKPEAVNIIP